MSARPNEAGSAQTLVEPFRLAADPPRVRRLSRKVLTAIGGVAGLTIAGALFYALKVPSHKAAENLIDTTSPNKAQSVTAAPDDYSKVPKLGAPLPGDLGRPILSAQEAGTLPSATAPTPPTDPQNAALNQAQQRVAAERDAAPKSTLFLGNASPAGGAPGSASPNVSIVTPPADQAASSAAVSDVASKRAFLAHGERKPTASAQRVSAAISPYVLQAGSIIPAALITGIRSDLPGQITAQVTQNVYDSPTGRILLIAQGSRLIGEYDSGVSRGQSRVLFAWDRLILPSGRSILLDRQPGADAAGMAGLQDKTNYHWGAMLKAALISTLLSAGTELASDSDDALVEALRDGSQDTLSQTGRQVVQHQLNIAPTLTIRPGYPLRVVVTRDLVLEPIGEVQ